MTIYPLSQLGTAVTAGGRKNLPYSSNLSAAYVPQALLTPERFREPVDGLQTFPTVTPELIEQLRLDVEDHFERRLQLFFQQLLLVYKTGRAYKTTKAYLQFGTGNAAEGRRYAAAHNSTLPSLICVQGEATVLFAKGTSLYDNWNETTALPEVVNKMDTRLDLHNKKIRANKALRKVAVEVLNQVAEIESPLNPKQGFQTFLVKTAALVAGAEGAAQGVEATIFGYYKTSAEAYKNLVNQGDTLLKKLCLVPDTTECNEEFFQDLQLYMYKTLLVPSDASALAQKLFTRKTIEIAPIVLTGCAKKYAATCHAVEAIRTLAAKYLKDTSATTIQADLKLLDRLRDSGSAARLGLSVSLKAIYDAALIRIRATSKVKEPQNMGSILTSILSKK